MLLEKLLEKLAIIQRKHALMLGIVFLIITLFMLVGATKIRMQSDLSETSPDDLEIKELNELVQSKFGSQDIILVLLNIDYDSDSEIQSIKDPIVINYLTKLQKSLALEPSIDTVYSPGSGFINFDTIDENTVSLVFENAPQLEQFISEDLRTTYMIIKADVGGDQEKVNAVTDLVNKKIDQFSRPAMVDIIITGQPPMQVVLMDILARDAVYTLTVAFLLIFLLLIILERSLNKAVLVSIPLMIAIIWTLGTMGWIGLEITMATAGLGAMVLGLGVEYGIFMLTRYWEERNKGFTRLKSLKISVPAVGFSILGSSMTTVTGFLALTLSSMPILQKLGLSLALGIFYCLFSSVVIAPIIYIGFEILEIKAGRKIRKFLLKEEELYNENN